MKLINTDKVLKNLEDRVLFYAEKMGRTLPEIRFFILNGLEFASLLEKHVYPTSPVNIWEGKRMVTKKFRIESGQESSLYYEVVQTGNPSYAYLNNTNSPMMQASVMAHVVGHCEFSELNVLKDSNSDRTEYVMYLVKNEATAGRKYLTSLKNLHPDLFRRPERKCLLSINPATPKNYTLTKLALQAFRIHTSS
jgi:hypothetical protein